ncbi:MAG: GNAT family N-acetyltransferase [Bacteroidota bacterium]|nr:GNAT family N-acetyltransferase [Bacteroidota bacterium]
MGIIIRNIKKNDNPLLAELIRTVFREFNIDQPGTVYTDPATDNLFELFQNDQSAYFVAEKAEQLMGGCGIYPTDGLTESCAELVKFYLSPESRGKGIGKRLLEASLNKAKELGYRQIYLESFPELDKAIGMYAKAGFKALNKPLGNSGHTACTIWMIKELG